MRLASALALITLILMSPALFVQSPAPALAGFLDPSGGTSSVDTSLVERAKIVCGQTPEGYSCRHEPGEIRRGKMRKVPKRRGDTDDSVDPDALPPAPADGTSGGGATAAGACPPNSERLGGHCIPYTQTCNRGLEGGAPPQVCRGREEKLVCDFRPDGLKDCCCRTYSQF